MLEICHGHIIDTLHFACEKCHCENAISFQEVSKKSQTSNRKCDQKGWNKVETKRKQGWNISILNGKCHCESALPILEKS